MSEINPVITYKASKTMTRFHKSTAFVRTLIGPVGSGKSVACVVDLLSKAIKQQPDQFNIRKTRWVVMRNTYRELIDTTMVTFHNWIPKTTGHFSAQNLSFTFEQYLPDETKVEAEFLFRALDRPDDVKKLLSLDLTGGWGNECREIPKAVIDMLMTRCGRYPQMSEGGPTWFGVILDTNPMDNDHWYYKTFEENKPPEWDIFHQPSGTGPTAENIGNLPPNYYKNIMVGKDKEWINVYVHGNYGFVAEGKPIFPEYKDDIHHSDIEYIPDPRLTLYIGIDFGLTPAAVIGQKTASGQMVLFDELVTFDMGAMNFGRLLREKLNSDYADFKNIEIYADPAGEGRAQTDETTPFLILRKQGINALPTYTNDFTIRREVIADYLQRLDFSGEPAFRVTGKAIVLRKGLAGGYKYKRVQVSGEEKYQDKPDKGRYSHVCDACQYLFLGAVGGSRVVGGHSDEPIDYSKQQASYR